MKSITTLILTVLLLGSFLIGCTDSSVATEPTVPAKAISETATDVTVIPTEIPDETDPQPTLGITIETIPQSTDDSDYQLPPGERPTLEPQDK